MVTLLCSVLGHQCLGSQQDTDDLQDTCHLDSATPYRTNTVYFVKLSVKKNSFKTTIVKAFSDLFFQNKFLYICQSHKRKKEKKGLKWKEKVSKHKRKWPRPTPCLGLFGFRTAETAESPARKGLIETPLNAVEKSRLNEAVYMNL